MSETWNRVRAVLNTPSGGRLRSIGSIIKADGSGRLTPERVYQALKTRAAGANIEWPDRRMAALALDRMEAAHLQDRRVAAAGEAVCRAPGLKPLRTAPTARKRARGASPLGGEGKTARDADKRAKAEARKAGERAQQAAGHKGTGKGKGGKGK